jgi:hypothetical protein
MNTLKGSSGMIYLLHFISVFISFLEFKVPYQKHPFKGTQAWNFLNEFFAETETLWSQGTVTWDFKKSYSIRLRYSTFKHFCVCSASDEIHSAYAQPAMKFVRRMPRVQQNLLRVCSACIYCSHFTAGWACVDSYAQCVMKLLPCLLSVRYNCFCVCSACACNNFRKLLKNPKLKCKFRPKKI